MEVLAALHFSHQRGVIHRDVKPSNVRIMPDGRIKIMDFGIARLQKADATGSGAIVGTPTYMAPEQITNGAITAATDVFSVGCLLYELLCYRRPFEAESVHGVLYQVLTTEPRPLRTVAPSIPAALERGDQSLALRGYVESAQRYAQARDEARAMEREAQHMIQRVTPVVQALPAGRAAANAGVFLARAESLLREQDYTLAKVAAQSAEQIGIDAGIAPPSTQPADARGAIDVLLDDLGRALASQRISNLRVLYPGLTEEERRSWEAFFREWNQITAKFTVEDFKTQGASATGNVRALFQYVPAHGGAPRMDRRRFAMRFEKKDVGWRLAAVTELK